MKKVLILYTELLNMNTIQEAEEIATEYGYELTDLYVHIPASGKANTTHIELADDFSHTEIPNDLNTELMKLVDVSSKQPATKHEISTVLK